MTPDESQEKREAWVIDYLYGELDNAQKQSFERALEHDDQLRALYEQQMSFDDVMPRGSTPEISEARVQGIRWSSFRAVKLGPKPSILARFARMREVKISLAWQVAAMALMFTVGFLVNNSVSHSVANSVPHSLSHGVSSTVNNNEENSAYNIVDVRLESVDLAQGEVAFILSKQFTSRVQGNIDNAQVRTLLTQSLNRNTNDGVRLQLTEFFSNYVEFEDVKTALIYTLKTDPNPGVRYNAVENLVKTPNAPKVREALIHALVHDTNPGIRVEAFLALSQRVDESLQEILDTYGVNDANTFIRERSKRILQKTSGGNASSSMPQPNIKSTNDAVSI